MSSDLALAITTAAAVAFSKSEPHAQWWSHQMTSNTALSIEQNTVHSGRQILLTENRLRDVLPLTPISRVRVTVLERSGDVRRVVAATDFLKSPLPARPPFCSPQLTDAHQIGLHFF